MDVNGTWYAMDNDAGRTYKRNWKHCKTWGHDGCRNWDIDYRDIHVDPRQVICSKTEDDIVHN